MPGSLCNGVATDAPLVRQSKTYCEGRRAAVDGVLIGSNPFPAGTVENADWARGHTSYAAGVGTALPRDCCADLAYDGVP